MQIAGRKISQAHAPFVIAEMSGNHNHDLNRALKLVEAAAKAGAHGLKIQTYTADTLTLDVRNKDFMIDSGKTIWEGQSLYELYQKAYTPWEWHKPIFDKAKELGLIAFSTPFDNTAVDFLEKLDVPCYKIASFENADLPLIKKVAQTGKPMIISTGMATIAELDETVRTARENGCNNLVLLKCTSSYPATPENSNIRSIPHLRELFACEVGLSDHTLGTGVSVASVALGATVIEKHFTLKRADGGVDAAFSMEPAELKSLVEESKRAWQGLGQITYGPGQAEKASMVFRRSLYVAENMKKGDVFTAKNLRSVRPGYGLAPKYYDKILGKKITCDAQKGTALTWELVG